MDAAWSGPPRWALGRAVPLERFLARSERAVVALEHAVAYREGCLLVLHSAVRRGVSGLDDSGLRYGVRFPDGSRATPVGHAFEGWAPPTDRPEPPMLTGAGSETSGDRLSFDCHQRL